MAHPSADLLNVSSAQLLLLDAFLHPTSESEYDRDSYAYTAADCCIAIIKGRELPFGYTPDGRVK